MTVRVRCPAKINRHLLVFELDESGMHPIHTEFQAIGLFDELEITESDAATCIQCDWDGLPKDNTLTKCLRLVEELVEIPPLSIRLTKRIPAQSGLGGGSSDAAGLLRALRSFSKGLVQPQMEFEVATSVGADVPFFLVGGRAVGEDYGQTLAPLPDLPTSWFVIARPLVGISTAQAYATLDALDRQVARAPLQWTGNDFELVAPSQCLALKEQMLSLGSVSALLCGSGSAVFGEFQSEAKAISVGAQIQNEGVKTWVAPSLGREESLWIS